MHLDKMCEKYYADMQTYNSAKLCNNNSAYLSISAMISLVSTFLCNAYKIPYTRS